MPISDATRGAMEDLLIAYVKSGWPSAWCGYSNLPEEAYAVSGFKNAYVMADGKSITLVDAPNLRATLAQEIQDGETIPFMPFALPGHPHTLPPSFHHPFKLLLTDEPIAKVRFFPKSGAEISRAAKNKIDSIRHPVVVIEMTRWKAPKGTPNAGEWEIGLAVRPKELAALLQATALKIVTKSNAIAFGVLGERAGMLMQGMDGILEYYGPARPCIIRSLDEAVVSIMMAPSAQDVVSATAKREDPTSQEPPAVERKLPGFEDKEDEDDEEGTNQGTEE